MIKRLSLFGEQDQGQIDRRIRILNSIKKNESLIPSQDYFEFGSDYFDNPGIIQGYGGYEYDGRYREYVKNIIHRYKLKKKSKILEIGCAKGFILKEFKDCGMEVYGVDNSLYAISNTHPSVKSEIKHCSAEKLKFIDNFFDLIICKDVLPHISPSKIDIVLSEIKRVLKGQVYLEIQCGNSSIELENLLLWDPTHKIVNTPDWWSNLINKKGLNAIVYFKILIPDTR